MAMGSPGADSSTAVTADMIQGATSLLGAAPVFWGRYFTSVSTTGDVEYRHETENAPLNAADICLLPIARQSLNVGGSASLGISDGQANAQDFIATFGVDVLAAQGGQFYMFLDVEGSPSLSPDYFEGWAQGLAQQAQSLSAGAVQILPCLYASHDDTDTWNALATAIAAGTECPGAWVARYYTGQCAMGEWSDDVVTPSAPSPFPCPILGWQYADDCLGGQIDCSQTNPAIDLDSQLLAFLVLPPGQ